MFLSREIDIKRFKNYTKTYICKILHKIRSIKQIILNKYATNLKTTISQRSLRNSNLLLLLFEFNNFSFLLDIIDNIIYMSGLWTMSPALQPMAVQYFCHLSPSVSCDQYTALGIILTQFYVNFSRQEHQIGIVQLLRFSGFILHHFSFFLYNPFKE